MPRHYISFASQHIFASHTHGSVRALISMPVDNELKNGILGIDECSLCCCCYGCDWKRKPATPIAIFICGDQTYCVLLNLTGSFRSFTLTLLSLSRRQFVFFLLLFSFGTQNSASTYADNNSVENILIKIMRDQTKIYQSVMNKNLEWFRCCKREIRIFTVPRKKKTEKCKASKNKRIKSSRKKTQKQSREHQQELKKTALQNALCVFVRMCDML